MLRLSSLAMLVCVCVALGCESKPPGSGMTGSAANGAGGGDKLRPVKIALNWFPEAEHGGFYTALINGYYKEAGLDVTIVPGGPDVPLIQEIAAGRLEFGVDNADKLLLVRALGADVVAVMSPLQDSPRSIMVHANGGPTTFEELAARDGLVLSMNAGQPFAEFMTKKLGLGKAVVVPYAGNVAQFLLEKNYAQQAYSFSEPFVAKEKGGDPANLMVSDLGFNPYTSLLLTSRKLVDAEPELVRKVTAASIRGWQTYLDNPSKTNEYIQKQNTEMPFEALQYGAEVLKPLCLPGNLSATKLGLMTSDRWAELVRQMEEIGALDPGKSPAEKAYTTQFLGDL